MTLENPFLALSFKQAKRLYIPLLTGIVTLSLFSCAGTITDTDPVSVADQQIQRNRPLQEGEAFFNYILAQIHLRDQNWEEAETAFNRVIEADEQALDALVLASHLAVQRGNIELAVKHTQDVIKLDPERQKSRMLLASLLTTQKKYSEAAQQYETLLSLKSEDDSIVRFLLAQTYGQLKDERKVELTLQSLFKHPTLAWQAYLTYGRSLIAVPKLEEAAKAFYKSHQLAPDEMQPVLALGILLQKLNRPEESEKIYRDYLTAFPENKAIHSRLGRLLLNQNNRGGALEEFRAISNLAPDNIQARLTTGLILLSEHKYEEALQELRLAEATEPSNTTVQYYIGQTLEFLNSPEKAEFNYHKILDGDNFHQEAQLRLAHIESASERIPAAIERIQKLTEKNPTKTEYLRSLTLINLQAKNYSEAVKYATKTLAIDPKNSEMLFNRAIAYDKLNRWADAEKDLKKYIKDNPDDAHALNYLGYTWAEKNIYLEESRALLERAAHLAPEDGFVSDSLGWVLYRLKEYDASLDKMKKAVLLEPTDPTIREHLGDVFHAMGKKKEALEVWKQALDLDPNNQGLREKIEKYTR
ncbi:MAG: tetratricopeptide repeat protein [Magnetococcales bacterium]|nr:tetratricopeptide repeat protein [Magnetococcales bacterium]